MYPDAAVSLEVEDTDVIGRLLPPRLARWRNRRNQKLERRRKRKERKHQKREAKIAKRREKLITQAEKKKADRLVRISTKVCIVVTLYYITYLFFSASLIRIVITSSLQQ